MCLLSYLSSCPRALGPLPEYCAIKKAELPLSGWKAQAENCAELWGTIALWTISREGTRVKHFFLIPCLINPHAASNGMFYPFKYHKHICGDTSENAKQLCFLLMNWQVSLDRYQKELAVHCCWWWWLVETISLCTLHPGCSDLLYFSASVWYTCFTWYMFV